MREEASLLAGSVWQRAVIEAERREYELWCWKRAVAVAERGPDTVVAKSHDVRAAVRGQVGEQARMSINEPEAGPNTEVRNDEQWLSKRAVAVAERGPHAVFSEPDDVRLPGARQIREKARMLFHPPSAARAAAGRELEFRILERPGAVDDIGPHAVFSEPDDFLLLVTRRPPENARLPFPTLSGARNAEVRKDEQRLLKRAVAVAERGPHAVFSEPDDVRLPGARQICENARMLFHPPSAARVAEARELDFRLLARTFAAAERGPHAAFSTPDDLRTATLG